MNANAARIERAALPDHWLRARENRAGRLKRRVVLNL
jgi:hypothetical protein